MLTSRHRLAVWGDPIDHSRSPAIHAAAYRSLGVDWDYGRASVADAEFARSLARLDDTWRGLSLTFPLKGAAFDASIDRDLRAEMTGAVNTLLLTDDGPRGFNTDVGGIVGAVHDLRISSVERARIIGAGATATSTLVALSELGATRVEVVARRPEAAKHLVSLGTELGLAVTAMPLGAAASDSVDVTIATLPGGVEVASDVADSLARSGGLLLDVVYGHWPTALATAWARTGRESMSGLGMLLHQALIQVRIFVTGDPDTTLDDEARVFDAMRRAVVGD